MRSLELQTKEKQKVMDKGEAVETMRSQVATGDRQDTAGRLAGDGETEVEEMMEAEVPLVRKKRRLMKAGENPPTKENVAAEDTRLVREVTEQGGSEPRAMGGFGGARGYLGG